jgi:hypothetical protein
MQYFDLRPGKFFKKKHMKLENTGEIADFTRFSSNSRFWRKNYEQPSPKSFFFFSGSKHLNPPGPHHSTNIVSVLPISSSRPFQRAIVELIKRQDSKVIARRKLIFYEKFEFVGCHFLFWPARVKKIIKWSTDDKVKYKAFFKDFLIRFLNVDIVPNIQTSFVAIK